MVWRFAVSSARPDFSRVRGHRNCPFDRSCPAPKVRPERSCRVNQDQALRAHVLALLRNSEAHLNFDSAVADLPPKLQGAKPAGVPHSPWRLLEHMRIAQWDIL